MILPKGAVMLPMEAMMRLEGGKIPSRGMKQTAKASYQRNKSYFNTYSGPIIELFIRKAK